MIVIKTRCEVPRSQTQTQMLRARAVVVPDAVIDNLSVEECRQLLRVAVNEVNRLEAGLTWWVEVKMKFWRDFQYGKAIMRRVLEGANINDVVP